MTEIVMIGAGQAAGQTAASLRQEGFDGAITIFGDEAYPPYQRPPLSKQYLSGEQGLERVFVRPEKFYADQNIGLKTNSTISNIQPESNTVVTADGESCHYDKLLIATGSRPRMLNVDGADLKGIYYLRTIADVDRIRAAMTDARRICIVGGGYIGLEVAAVAVSSGLEVSVIEMENRILQRVTTPEMSAFYHQLHEGHGVKIQPGTTVVGFEGNEKVTGVLLDRQDSNGHSHNRIDADIVIIGIGILPNTELAQAAGIACDNGILVDDQCHTSIQHIFAAGDCTNHPNPILGRRLRLESVPNAMEQARVAAANMTGGDKRYQSIPWFWSDQYDLKLQMVGFSSDGDQTLLRGNMSGDNNHQFAMFYLKDGAIVAVDAVNSPREFMVCKQLYGKQVDIAALADTTVDLKSLLH